MFLAQSLTAKRTKRTRDTRGDEIGSGKLRHAQAWKFRATGVCHGRWGRISETADPRPWLAVSEIPRHWGFVTVDGAGSVDAAVKHPQPLVCLCPGEPQCKEGRAEK